jgi:hypothetical protein
LHYDTDGHREFVHSETGVRTLKEEFEKVASHNEHHLEQIELALKGFGSNVGKLPVPPTTSHRSVLP